jgi:hypothetical protein
MNKYFSALGETDSPIGEQAASSGEYGELIHRLFKGPSSVAIVGIGVDKGVVGVCEGIAKELAESGKRVVIVPVASLLRSETALITTIARNVWLWPSPLGRPLEFFNSPESQQGAAHNWLEALQRNFDSVLLDCPALDLMFGVAEVAAMADAVVLVVQSGRTSKQHIQDDQRALQLRGATLAGCILLRGK